MSFFTTDLERLSFQSIRHQLIIVDRDWRIRSCNTAWQNGLGRLHLSQYKKSDVHRPSYETFHYLQLLQLWAAQEEETENSSIIQKLEKIHYPLVHCHTYDISIQPANLDLRWFRLELTPLNQTDPPSPMGLVLISHTDITEQKRIEQQLKLALSEVRTLRGLLPICAVCKQIKDEQDVWNSVEGYLERHTHAEFTHDICPDCIRRLYPKYSNILDKRS
ncbi:hypothetical protein [Paenibacillus sp. ACRRY]|uniref:hypothetical protein n=1 Tax=Paenibacillus sp. ACRRY TaxID=2918208 RepID=UPI001EF5B041|nr:hypothetical protein [Paenibacillus sp. ACRRY]MCG7385192.1 hypothetical protein [Paenibacillus sp. ACRRY]